MMRSDELICAQQTNVSVFILFREGVWQAFRAICMLEYLRFLLLLFFILDDPDEILAGLSMSFE
jgi:hypothetical protein